MRFSLKTVSNGCRLGCLNSNNDGNVGIDLNTPLCFLYTRGGSAPHLTRDLLNKLVNVPGVVQVPLTLLAENVEILKQYGLGIGSFAAMKDFLVYCSLQDSAELVPTGYNSNAGVSVWCRGGKMTLGVDAFMKTIDAVLPDWYQALCDSDTLPTSSRKRIRKSVDRTLQYVDKCIEQQSKLPRLSKAGIIGVVQGGYCMEERLRSVRETVKRPVSGFCIEGFHSSGPDTEGFRVDTIRHLLEAVLKEIPEDKPRMLPGLWNPLDIIQAVKMGIDIFDSTYPYIMTARGSALVFNYDASTGVETGSGDGDLLEISLKDDRYRQDSSAVVEGCPCYTCTTHSRAYIYHLLDTSELLASVLLMMHNFHHYFGFFRAVRNAIADNTLDSLEHRLARLQYPIATLNNKADLLARTDDDS